MKLPLQTKGCDRLASTAPIKSDITATQFLSPRFRTRRHLPIFIPPMGGIAGPRTCEECDLLFLACKAAGLPDATCVADDIECRITCTWDW